MKKLRYIDKLRKYTFDDLHTLFNEGKIPSFEEIEGETAGSFLAWNPQNPWWIGLFIKILFNSPYARWKGKKFITPFGKDQRGKGFNLFQNRIFPHRFRFDTYIKQTYLDDKNLCLALDYRLYPSLMAGLVDNVLRIEEGVYLGQMHYKFPLKKEFLFLGYFILCVCVPRHSV